MHMVRAVEERANTGSVSMINSDVLESVSLSNGGYPQRSGNRTGAEVGFVVREGSRDRTLVRASVSGTAASMTVEGPLGSAHRGSWLISGRKSYLDLLVRKLREEGLSFGFADAQAKLRHDVGANHSAALTFLVGKSRLRELPEQVEDTDLFTGDNASAIAIGSWRTGVPPRCVCCRSSRRDEPLSELQPDGYRAREGRHRHRCGPIGPYASARHACGPRIGALVEHINETQRKQRPSGASVTILNDYRAAASRQGAHARMRFDVGSRLTLSPGARFDRWSLTDQKTASPWMQSELALPGRIVVRAGWGVYQQFADFEEAVGAFAGSRLVPERSAHADLGVEHRLSPSTRYKSRSIIATTTT